jgi:hypothetical protein
MSWRKTQASEPAACEGVNGEQREAYDERLQLLDDIFETAERFKEEEADKRKCVKEKEDALEAAGKRVRQQAMQRQNSCSEDAAGTLSADNDEPEDVDAISIAQDGTQLLDSHGGPSNISTPGSSSDRRPKSRETALGQGSEAGDSEFLNSAKMSLGARVNIEARRLEFEQRKWEGESEIASKRAKLDEDRYEREADIQRERLSLEKRRIEVEIEERKRALKAHDDKDSSVHKTLSNVETAINKQSDVLMKLMSYLAEKK